MKISQWLEDKCLYKALQQAVSDPTRLQKWYARQIIPGKKRLFLTAAPKSGSTYLSKLLAKVFDLPLRDACGTWGYLEQQIYPPRLIPFVNQDGLVGNQHLRGSPESIEWLNLFGFQTIILYRDLADSVVSIKDHQLKNGHLGSLGFINREMLTGMTDSQHIDYIITEVMPWYVAFFSSWKYFSHTMAPAPIWLNYRDLISSPHDVINQVAATLGSSVEASKIDEAIAQVQGKAIRFNVGKSGRGREQLSNSQIEHLASIIEPYQKFCDFSEIFSFPETSSDSSPEI